MRLLCPPLSYCVLLEYSFFCTQDSGVHYLEVYVLSSHSQKLQGVQLDLKDGDDLLVFLLVSSDLISHMVSMYVLFCECNAPINVLPHYPPQAHMGL